MSPPPAFVQRLALARRCGHAPLVDLSGVLGDARALQQLVAALWRPFAQLRVAQAAALLPATSNGGSDRARHSAARALAAALAAAHHIGAYLLTQQRCCGGVSSGHNGCVVSVW